MGWTYNPKPPAELHRLQRLTVWGPPPVTSMVAGIERAYGFSTELFEVGAGFPPWRPVTTAREFRLPKRGIVKVMEDENVVVRATRVFHGPEVRDAYAYRFDIKATGRSVVFSGDTAAPNTQLIALAQDADLLVHAVQLNSYIPRILQNVPPGARAVLEHHFRTTLPDVNDVPKVAKAANVRRLAFYHYFLGFDLTPSAYVKAGKKAAGAVRYRGELVVPDELDLIAA